MSQFGSPSKGSGVETLADLVQDRPDEEPVPEQVVYVGRLRVILQATLARTAVVRSLPDLGERKLVRLDCVTAGDSLRWRLKDGGKRTALHAANRGRANALQRKAWGTTGSPETWDDRSV